MKKLLAFLLLLSSPAFGQSTAMQTQPGFISTTCSGSALTCFVPYSSTNPLPVSVGTSSITGVLPIVNGGTGLATIGTSGQVLTSNGTSLFYNTPGASSVTIGTSVSNTNPRISGVAGSGLYTDGTNVGVSIGSTSIGLFSANNLNLGSGVSYKINGVNAMSFPSSDTTAGASIAIGSSALANQPASAAYSNTAIGYQAMSSASMTTTAIQNTAVGYQALANLTGSTGGGGYTAVGYQACNGVLTGTLGGTTCIGRSAGSLDGGATGNVYIGDQAGMNNVSGSESVYIGRQSGVNATGSSNVVIGLNSMTAVTTGGSNTVIGQDSGKFIGTTSHDNTLMGQSVYKQNTGAAVVNYSTCLGSSSCQHWNHSGDAHNIAVGWNAMLGNTDNASSTGANNVAIGDQAGLNWTTAANTVLIGQGTPAVNSTTIQNSTIIGAATAPNLTTGSSNICLGYQSCTGLTNGHDNIAIGNATSLASSAVGVINIGGLIYGTSGTSVGIGTTTPSASLSIRGGSVNGVDIAGSATTVAPSITATGTDTNVSLILAAKGTGGVGIGTTLAPSTITVVGSAAIGNVNVDNVATCNNTYHAFIGPIGTVGGDECPALNVTQLDVGNNAIMRLGSAGAAWAGEFLASATGVVFNTKTSVPIRFAINGSEKMRVDSTGSVGIGTNAPNTGVALDVGTPTSSILLPIGTTGTRPATGINGMLRYNSTTPSVETYANNVWTSLGAGGAGTVTTVSVTTANGVSGSVATATTTPAITITLNAITPTTIVASGAVSATGFTPTTTAGIVGTTTNNNAAAGIVGEFVTSNVAAPGSSISSGVVTNVTSISLTAGDWDVDGTVAYRTANTTIITKGYASISTTSATLPASGVNGTANFLGSFSSSGDDLNISSGRVRLSLSGTTTVYLIAFTTFSISTETAFGTISARRVR